MRIRKTAANHLRIAHSLHERPTICERLLGIAADARVLSIESAKIDVRDLPDELSGNSRSFPAGTGEIGQVPNCQERSEISEPPREGGQAAGRAERGTAKGLPGRPVRRC